MRDWADEPFVKVYTRDEADWIAMPLAAQSVALLLLRKMDRAGFLKLGRRGIEALPAILGKTSPEDVDFISAGIRYLLDVDGCVKLLPSGGLFWANYLDAQRAQASDRARKAAQRERSAAAAQLELLNGGNVTPGGHGGEVTPEVTLEVTQDGHARGHAGESRQKSRLDEIRRDETRSDEKDPSAAPSASGDQESPKKERKPSTQQAFASWFSEERAKVTQESEEPIKASELNAKAKAAIEELGLPGAKAAALNYLGDPGYPARCKPPYPIGLFFARFRRYKADPTLPAGTTPLLPDEDPYRV